MHWTVTNLIGCVGWLAGLACLKGSMGETTMQMALSRQSELALGAVLCLCAASYLVWTNLRS